jgi:hypothetical protein
VVSAGLSRGPNLLPVRCVRAPSPNDVHGDEDLEPPCCLDCLVCCVGVFGCRLGQSLDLWVGPEGAWNSVQSKAEDAVQVAVLAGSRLGALQVAPSLLQCVPQALCLRTGPENVVRSPSFSA